MSPTMKHTALLPNITDATQSLTEEAVSLVLDRHIPHD